MSQSVCTPLCPKFSRQVCQTVQYESAARVDGRVPQYLQVRVLMENAGMTVNGLKRVRIGGFRLPRDLSIGEFRELKPYVAKRVIDRSVEMNPQTNPVLDLN